MKEKKIKIISILLIIFILIGIILFLDFKKYQIFKTNNTIKSTSQNTEKNSDKLEWSIEIKRSLDLYTYTIKNLIVPKFDEKAWIIETEIIFSENIDISKSKVEVIFSTSKLAWIKRSIFNDFWENKHRDVIETIASILSNTSLAYYSNMLGELSENKYEIKKNLEKWIKKLESMQLKSWWFIYWEGDTKLTNLKLNSYILSTLIEIKKIHYSKVLDNLIDNSIVFLKNNFSWNLELSDQIHIFFALNKAWEKIKLEINSKELNRYELLKYTYWLFYFDKNKYKKEIENNLILLSSFFEKYKDYKKLDSDITKQKAIFTSLLLDLDYNKVYTDRLITSLYLNNYSSDYFSTKTKINTFLVFIKYTKKEGNNRIIRYWYSLWDILNRGDIFWIWWKYWIVKKEEFNLSDLIITWDKKVYFRIANLSPWILYSTIIFKKYSKY